MGLPNLLRHYRKAHKRLMEVPEWVRIVSHGTCEELREFIRANPGFDWDRTAFDGSTAFCFVWIHNSFPLSMCDTLHVAGGARFDSVCDQRRNHTPMDIASYQCDTRMVKMLLDYNVRITKVRHLLATPNMTETILEHSSTLTTTLVNHGLDKLKKLRGSLHPTNILQQNSLLRWLVSHNYRRDASLCVAWTLSQITGTMWPDTREQLLERLMATRVREW